MAPDMRKIRNKDHSSMSRFYDVLKEASRWPQDADGGAPDGRPGAAGIPPAEMPPFAADLEPAAASAPSAAASVAPDPISRPEQVTGSGVQNGFTANSTQVRLDGQARLIPHVAGPAAVECYRRLRTKILQEQAQKMFRTLVVTSPGPQEGKTVTALNLALSFAMLPSFKILVVDGDLRKGTLGYWLGVENRCGLSNLIAGSATLHQVVMKSDDSPLHFILRGDADNPPAELLNSPQLTSSLRRISESFDLVLVDSPPVNLLTDAHLLAGSCDAVLLVARAFSTTRKALERAVQDLLPFRVIGTVLNAGTGGVPRRYHKYYRPEP